MAALVRATRQSTVLCRKFVRCATIPSFNRNPTLYDRHRGGNRLPGSGAARNWRLPSSDDDFERFLMRWENIAGNDFLEQMRNQCVRYKIQNLSEKQKIAIANTINHPMFKVKRAVYPKKLLLDPIMKDLLLLNEQDMKEAESLQGDVAKSLKSLREQLCEKGYLSYKQLKFAGSLLSQLPSRGEAAK
mmetsp:Transcript_68942/g.109459  ORF Transcript_68942/g.109459 Transcript_68942/m.109459 type:complete len:188 (+) Transcript_68942:39-602(+)